MTVEELCAYSDFVALCHCWKRDGRCPVCLGDWLRDLGEPGMAAGADWAATSPDRWGMDGVGGVRPDNFTTWYNGVDLIRSHLPTDVFDALPGGGRGTPYRHGHTYPSTDHPELPIAAFLVAWAAARGPGAVSIHTTNTEEK